MAGIKGRMEERFMMNLVIIEIRSGAIENICPASAKVRIVDWDDLKAAGIQCSCGSTDLHADMSTSGEWFICNACGNNFYFGHYMEENQ